MKLLKVLPTRFILILLFSNSHKWKIKMKKLEEIVKEVLAISADYRELSELIEESIDVLWKSSGNFVFHEPGVVEIKRGVNLHIIGDLHGDIHSLLNILEKKYEFLKEDSHVFVFLGDYVDRGDYQVETLAAILYLKTKYEDKFILLRGNHEPPAWLIPHPHDFPSILAAKYGDKGGELYSLFQKLFEKLPLVAYVQGELLMLHGGPPVKVLETDSFRDAFSLDSKVFHPKIIEEVLWNDPIDLNVDFLESPRGAGRLYGKKVTARALNLIRGKYIVRSHEVAYGYNTSHEGLVITVFDAAIPYGLDVIGVVEYVYNPQEDNYKLDLAKIRVEY